MIKSILHRREENYNRIQCTKLDDEDLTSLLLLPLPNGSTNARRRLVFFLEVSAVVTEASAAVSISESFMMIDMLEGVIMIDLTVICILCEHQLNLAQLRGSTM